MPTAKASKSSCTLPRYDVSAPPSHPELHAQHQTLTDVLQPQYWQRLNPALHVGDAAFIAGCQPIKAPQQRLKDLASQINEAGVAQVEPEELPWTVDLALLADAVVNLQRHGWPPSLIVVYDEVWAMVQQASAVMKKATGGNECNMDILAWLVDPNRGDAGFSPHRDRQPLADDSPATFRASDGSAMYATMWVPLTHATPENSCLYVIPRFADPGYYVGDPEDEGAPDPMTAALPHKEAYQHIRALPAAPGAALLFTHRTIHWGSKGRTGYPTPRISISWGCADDAYEPPYFSRQHLPCPPLALRLGLVGAQMIIYHERFPAPVRQLKMYYAAFSAQSSLFDPTYRAKVKREFVDASKEATATAAAAAEAGGGGGVEVANGGIGGSSAKGSKGKKSKKAAKQQQQQQQQEEEVQAAAVQEQPAKRNKKKGQQQQPQQNGSLTQQQQPAVVTAAAAKSSKKRSKPAEQAAAAVAAGSGKDNDKPLGKKASKRQKKQQQQEDDDGNDAVAAALHAAGAATGAAVSKQHRRGGGSSSSEQEDDDSEDEGLGIDWALLAAQAKAHKKKAANKTANKAAHKQQPKEGGGSSKQQGAKKPGGGGLAAAAAAGAGGDGVGVGSSSSDDGDTLGSDVSDDEDDVMDLALEAMLDGNEGDFVDDYED